MNQSPTGRIVHDMKQMQHLRGELVQGHVSQATVNVDFRKLEARAMRQSLSRMNRV